LLYTYKKPVPFKLDQYRILTFASPQSRIGNQKPGSVFPSTVDHVADKPANRKVSFPIE
jgi:hypothetical protein